VIIGHQFGDEDMSPGFDVFKSVGGRNCLDGRSLGGLSLVEPEVKMTLAGNQFGMSLVIYQGEVGYGDFDGDFGTGNSLTGGGGDEREGRDAQSQGGGYKQGRNHVFIVREEWGECQGGRNLTTHMRQQI